jgi:hypothetical protein
MKEIQIVGLAIGLALLTGCASPQQSNQMTGSGGQQPAANTLDAARQKMPMIQIDGWIDSETLSTTTATGVGTNRSYTYSTPKTFKILRCSGGHDYVLFIVDKDLVGVTYTPGPANIYTVSGQVTPIPPKLSTDIDAFRTLVLPDGTQQARDVSYVMFVRSIQKRK